MVTQEGNDLSRSMLDDVMARDDELAQQQLRALSRRSLFFHTKAVSCYGVVPNLFTAEVFKERQDWIQWIFTARKRGLLEDPRYHVKTTGSTIAGSTWLAVQRPDERYDHPVEVERARSFLAQHPHLRGPDSRLVLLSDSMKTARRWVGSSLAQWETNPLLRWLHPELLWANLNRPDYGSWSNDGFSLPGRQNPREPWPYLRPAGTESKEQGGRADGLFVDDLVGEQEYRSETLLTMRREFIKTIAFLLENPDHTSPEGGFVLIPANRWTLDDVNSLVHDSLAVYEVWSRSIVRCQTHGAGNCGRKPSDAIRTCAPASEPLWKERHPTMESVAAVEATVGSEAFAAQCMNDPRRSAILDENKFLECSLAVMSVPSRGGGDPRGESGEPARERRAWCVSIPRGDASRPEVIPLDLLTEHYIVIDPASSTSPKAAATCVSWFALDRPTHRRFWLECRADRWSPGRAIHEMFGVVVDAARMLGRVPNILCEEVALQSYVSSALFNYPHTPAAMARAGGVRLRLPQVEGAKVPHGERKDNRQRERLGYVLDHGLLYLRTGLPLPRTETRHWPNGTRDAIDTLVMVEDRYLAYYGRGISVAAERRARARRELHISLAGPAGVMPWGSG